MKEEISIQNKTENKMEEYTLQGLQGIDKEVVVHIQQNKTPHQTKPIIPTIYTPCNNKKEKGNKIQRANHVIMYAK